jgi:CRISPR-associated protein Cmr1
MHSFSVAIKVVTPILGGGSQPRTIDNVDVIRPAAVRGLLRFWWRALRAHEFTSAGHLYEAESSLWGKAAKDEGGRSTVNIRIEVQQESENDHSEIQLNKTLGAYALWPAREEREKKTLLGTQFRLTILAPADYETELRNTVRAWILFGGYGSRTRRGFGSITVTEDAHIWLPANASPKEFESLFGRDLFASPKNPAVDTPRLAGAALHIGKTAPDAQKAQKTWTTALEWLKEFRQGTNGGPNDRAREPGIEPKRPSISNWPEADKVRHLKGKTKAHRPRHNATPAWPRAGFGLPIIGRFQKKARNGGQLDEPDGFELRWCLERDEYDRLASPLIVKALPLADGTFVPCALWLNRAFPNGKVVVRGVDVKKSAAPFDRLVAPGDRPRFSALDGKATLREAFLDWLHARHHTTVVAP